MTSMTGAANLLAALPGRYYTDPAIFELDQRQIFRRSWLCVGRA
ncbi:MAG: glycine betaine catabolism, partial [Pseudonocardiales bacterium]|nr:glycine betaine catabolism [Pseudonocardiales bacterium]